MPRIERLNQNTPEWHLWRRQGLGASDAPVVMGEAPFKTPRMLWAIKTGRTPERASGLAARRGRELEQVARRAYERQTGNQMEPLCLVHDELDWMRASLDGLSFDGSAVLEIKCPISAEGRAAAKQGHIPPPYYAQLQHQLEVSHAAEVHYWSYDGRAGTLIRVTPDREYQKRLVEAEARFWELVKGDLWPEPKGEELDLSTDPKWREIAVLYRQAKLRLETASAEEARLRAILENLATARRTFGCGVELLRGSRKGAVDYAAIPELRGNKSRALPQTARFGRQNQYWEPRASVISMQQFFGFRNFRQFECSGREIRLPYDLLNDLRFRHLPDARKAHLICLLMLSARMDNVLPNNPLKLEQLIGATDAVDLSALADFVAFAEIEEPTYESRLARRRTPDPLRAQVLLRDGARCRRCRTTVNLEIDHIVPVSKGGRTEESNLQTLCRRCNRRKWKKLIGRL
jgi:putative phage-type endonuclease